uniref:Synaptotagmin binding, cytoplasmic RNA interacting protein n=1 Tax=Cyprinus carpio carpio TaxID=630221 RepID=A0A9J7YFS1_CYPCA
MATEHINGNGTEEPMDTSAAVTHSDHFNTLLEAGLPQKVAEKLDEIYLAGLVEHSDLDERAIEALKEFDEDGALQVLVQFKESDLSHVQNKSAFLCGVMKTYRQREKQGTKVVDSTKGPDEAKIKCNNHEIRSGKHIGVCISVANNRLFVGSIPKSKTKEQIVEEFSKVTEGLTDVILYHQPDDKRKNRGFCFLEYEDHKTAAQARRRLMSGKVKVWGNVVTVEWADPIEDPDPEVMAKVKVLFVRNLANSVTEEILETAFGQFGKLERVKKLKDYAFIHFDERDGAVKALAEMNVLWVYSSGVQYDDYYYYGPPQMPPPARGRGRGASRGGYSYPPDYYGYEDYYDYYGYDYDYHNYRGGYDDPYFGYDDFQAPARGRGGRGGARGGVSPVRGRGASAPRGRAGFPQRGGLGASRSPRGGARGGVLPRGRGVRGTPRGPRLNSMIATESTI